MRIERVSRWIPTSAITTLANVPLDDNGVRKGATFRRDDGKPYADRERLAGGQIRSAWATACRRAGLLNPIHDEKGNGIGVKPSITPHDLRHTWASWFYAVTKDPLLLRDEGGWSTLSMVERYAHLMPTELDGDVHLVWGATHPRIGSLPIRAESVQTGTAAAKTA